MSLAMGCNVSKEHQVEQGGGEDGSTKSGKGSSKNKKCNKKSSQAEINCIGTPATDTEEKKMELEKGRFQLHIFPLTMY